MKKMADKGTHVSVYFDIVGVVIAGHSSGKTITFPTHALYEIADGKIVEIHEGGPRDLPPAPA